MRHIVNMNYLGPNPSDTAMKIIRDPASDFGDNTFIDTPVILISKEIFDVHPSSEVYTIRQDKLVGIEHKERIVILDKVFNQTIYRDNNDGHLVI